ncbi:MAG: tyrosine-type recombinase/integrase [Acidimicrobiia bacterium]
MRPAVTMPGYHTGRVPANKGKKYPAEILTPEEVRALFAQISTTTSLGLRNRALITLLYRAGLRHSEALGVMEKDVDLKSGAIAVLHGKGDRRRTVGIDPGACSVIALWIDRRRRLGFGSEVPLFCTLQGKPLKNSYLKQLLPKLAARAGIGKRVHPHGLRHTHAFELMMEGVEIPVIQRQLGHVSLATTSIYLNHIAPKQVIETMRKREWMP